MKYIKILLALSLALFFFNCASAQVKSQDDNLAEEKNVNVSNYLISSESDLPVLEFKEVWAYVVAGRESALTRNLPITDVAYFGAEVNMYGKLIDVPRRAALPSHFNGRAHLVIACNGRALTYFTLRPGSAERREFIADLLAATKNFDGLNIDLEYIPARSGEAFHSFLRELRAGLPKDKMFTICVPARTRKLADDIFDYDKITPLVDRVFVMAYDEHWSGSRPGSVASIAWCRNVASYSMRTIGADKLVMGLPFYGRAWGDYSPSRALIYTSIENVIKTNNVKDIKYENGIPTFTYNKNVSVKVYYEDKFSLVSRMNMYKSMGITSVGFWRLGQETVDVWKHLKISSSPSQAVAVAPPSEAPAIIPAAAPSPPPRPTSHTVRSGESLWTLSRRYGITMQALADANGMNIDDTLRIGKVLRIPPR